MITREAEKVASRHDVLSSSSSSSSSSMNAEPAAEPPAKRSKLFACYDASADTQQTVPTSAEAQMTLYLNLCSQQQAIDDCLEFWRKHETDLRKLYQLAMTVLSVPATSAAVERVINHGGLIMKPHRAQMSDKLLSNLIFLKCNL